jgi:SAM-dependent methyltransferase
MQKDKQFYDNFFTRYPIDVHNDPVRFQAVASLLSGRVLDVACGTGSLADYYNNDYFGIDISEVAINKAKAFRRKDARFMQGDVCTMPTVSTKQYDSIYAGEFLEHIQNDDLLFERLLKKLKPAGRIVVTVPNGERIPDESHCRTFTVPQIRRDYGKYGKITFHNWPGFASRLLFTIEPGKIDQNDMTLVMICKDEEKGIENAIITALPFVDHVVVSVDTKTTDKTAEIAKLYADELVYHEWKDNFSEARNSVQKLVKTKWTLFLDGHEFIDKSGNIEDLLKLDVDGLLCTIKMENGTSFMYPRIFRSHLKFENAVHNAVDVKTKEYAPNFVIVHDRLNAQSKASAHAREIQRDKMIPEIMAETLKKNPNDQRALFNLANWYMTKNMLEPALKTYQLCLKQTPSPDERYFVKAQIGMCHQLLNHNLRATWSFFDLEKLIPNRWETKRLLGGIYLQRGQYKKACEYLVFALDPNKKQYLYQLFGQDFAEIWDLIAMCFLEMEQPAKAVIAWQEAIKGTTEEKRKEFFQTKIRLCEMLLPRRIPVRDEGGSGEERPGGVQGQSPC